MKYNKKNYTEFLLVLIICTSWVLNFYVKSTEAANILFYYGGSLMYSHRTAVWPLVTSLADKGNNVTFSAIYHPKPEHVHPKVKEFFPKEYENALKQTKIAELPNFIELRLNYGRMGQQLIGPTLLIKGLEMCNLFLSANETQNWIQNSHFDLIIIDGHFSECGYALAYKFNATKTILFNAISILSWWHDVFGFPAETNIISELHLSFPFPLSFYERVISTIVTLVHYMAAVWIYCPKLDTLIRNKFNQPNFPSIVDLLRNTSLIFTNTHFSEEFARSLSPLIVSVGGLHLENDKQANKNGSIPKDILQFMDESGSNGFIYISFGSKAEISKAPKAIQDIFITAFRNTKTRFLWKWEDDKRPANMPSNVITAKWMPQQQILAHRNIKAFITHAGIMGLTEAINAGVPVIMIPIFSDQDYNAFRFERFARGIRLEISTLTTQKLENAIQEILTNQTYKQNMLKTRKLYLDRPASPLQTAIWWTEYVLRNDDLSLLKPLAMNQTWYEKDCWMFMYLLLDLF